MQSSARPARRRSWPDASSKRSRSCCRSQASCTKRLFLCLWKVNRVHKWPLGSFISLISATILCSCSDYESLVILLCCCVTLVLHTVAAMLLVHVLTVCDILVITCVVFKCRSCCYSETRQCRVLPVGHLYDCRCHAWGRYLAEHLLDMHNCQYNT